MDNKRARAALTDGEESLAFPESWSDQERNTARSRLLEVLQDFVPEPLVTGASTHGGQVTVLALTDDAIFVLRTLVGEDEPQVTCRSSKLDDGEVRVKVMRAFAEVHSQPQLRAEWTLDIGPDTIVFETGRRYTREGLTGYAINSVEHLARALAEKTGGWAEPNPYEPF